MDGLGVNPQRSAILAKPRVLEGMAEVAIGRQDALLKRRERTSACTPPPSPKWRRGDAGLVAVIIGMGHEAEAQSCPSKLSFTI